jgi:hypothetical protein
MKNEEIQNIKKIMGLQHNKDYSNTTSLRYGRLMIMTDQVGPTNNENLASFAHAAPRITMVPTSKACSLISLTTFTHRC